MLVGRERQVRDTAFAGYSASTVVVDRLERVAAQDLGGASNV